jgi:nucleotide-binding universal stress UspA family protein
VGSPTIEERTITWEGETQPEAEQRIKDELETYLAGAARGFVAQGVLTKQKVLFGDPVDEIVDYAKRERFDLIAMATHQSVIDGCGALERSVGKTSRS